MTHNEIIVVGAGAVGLSIAYNLMKKKKMYGSSKKAT